MSIYTNGNKIAYWDSALQGAPVFDTTQGRVVSVSMTLEHAIEVVEKGMSFCIRTQLNRLEAKGPAKHAINEYRRKVGLKFPHAHIF